MPQAITELMEKIDARIIRERILIFLSLLAVVFLLWDFTVQSRVDGTRETLEIESKKISDEQKVLELRIAELTAALASDPGIVRKIEIENLNVLIAELEARLTGLSQGLIGVSQLPKALEDVLQKTGAIKVLQVRTLPVDELRLESAPAPNTINDSVAAPSGTGVYKHAVLIRVSGSYLQLLQLMTEIEALPWRFYWESLDYQVTKYPDATIDIRVFTLSSEEGLLGV